MLSSRFLSPNTSLLYESTFSPTSISKNTRRERHCKQAGTPTKHLKLLPTDALCFLSAGC